MPEPDPELIARIDRLARVPFEGEGFRHLGPGYSPLSGEGARIQGGRWNPPNSFPALYLALQRESAIAEFYRRAEREGLPPANLLPRHLYRYRVALQQVLDLTDAGRLEAVGLSQAILQSVDASQCQAVGHAAHYAGFEALRAPSATGIGQTLAVFSDRLQLGSVIEPLDHAVWDRLPDPGRPLSAD